MLYGSVVEDVRTELNMEKNLKREKKKHKRKKIGYIGLFLSVFTILLIINILNFGGSVRTVVVRRGTEEETIPATAYIFREQTIVTTPKTGFLYCEAREDERVKSGEAIVSIYENEINSQANSELKTIEDKIKELSHNSLEVDVFSNDVARIEQDIATRLRSIPLYNYTNNIERIAEVRGETDKLIEKKRIILGEAEPNSNQQEIEKLKKRKAEIEQTNKVERTIIHSPKAGAFTARIDGMEELLSLDALANISPSYIKELGKQKISVKTAAKVNEGDAVGKIINNFTWSAASIVSKEDAEDIKIGDKLGIRFVNLGTDVVDGTVSKITSEENGKVVITVSSNKYVNMIYSTSKADVEYVKKRYKGLRIPAESIRIVNGVKGVYVIRSDIARFVPINILHNGKENVIVSEKMESGATIKLYDELVVGGKNIYDGKGVR